MTCDRAPEPGQAYCSLCSLKQKMDAAAAKLRAAVGDAKTLPAVYTLVCSNCRRQYQSSDGHVTCPQLACMNAKLELLSWSERK
jgi:hypothetical protein